MIKIYGKNLVREAILNNADLKDIYISANETKLIDSSELDYYISNIKQDNLTNFTEIKNIDNLYLYEKII